MKSNLITFIGICSLLLGIACQPQSEYAKLKEEELARNVRRDSLFLDIHFGMTRKQFYAHCWELNKYQMVKQGEMNMSVEYRIADLPYEATMNFYPNFYKEKIYEMEVKFSYLAWAPWNKDMQADSLIHDVVELLEDWYGKPFLTVAHPQKPDVFVSIDGNRRIRVYPLNERYVKVVFTDLLIESNIKKKSTPQKS